MNEWALVLASADIPHRVNSNTGEHHLSVDSSTAGSALAALSDYDRERRTPRPTYADVETGNANIAWLTASAIIVGHMAMGPSAGSGSAWTAIGAASARAIRGGEIWRCMTALTLHADAMHAVSNTISTLLFLSPLCRLLGGGTAITLTLTAGVLATLVNAFTRSASYSGIGFSTAVFAALGLLAAVQTTRRSRESPWRRYRTIGAAVAILAMLGAAPETDVMAHVLGLASGVAIGLGFARTVQHPIAPDIDRGLALASAAVVTGAWGLALLAS